MTSMFGYLNLALVGRDRPDTEARLEECANSLGGSIRGRIFCEPGSAVQPLWSLICDVDYDLGGQVLPRLYAAAKRRAMSMDRLLGSASPTPALWALLDALAHSDGAYLLVPSAAHFDHLGVPRQLLLQCISGLPMQVDVLFLRSSLASGSEPGLLAEIAVPAFTLAEEVVQVHLRRLARAGLGDLIEPIGELVHELVGAGLDNTAAELALAHNRIRVRVLCPPESQTVVIEVLESREHCDEPVGDVVKRICDPRRGGKAQRSRAPGGGTVTRCELLLPGVEQASMAKLSGLVHQYVNDHDGWTPPEWVSVATGGR